MLPCARDRTKVPAMLTARTLPELRHHCMMLRDRFGSLALVPTMGALHAGHMALVHAAAVRPAGIVTSIFVNPLQFGATEDLARYPRDEAGDLMQLEAAGCHLVWLPDVATMYPPGEATTISVEGPARRWEGDARPGHFRGVATVCAKLFGQVRPDRAYFGEKDWQQVQVVTRMVADLLLPLEIVPVETVREPDGLALSSRNRFITAAERPVAAHLPETMRAVITALERGEAVAPVLERAREWLTRDGFAVDYLALVDGPTLAPLDAVRPGARLIVAAKLGSVRLIDNMSVGG
jgi:pantoate--beta-alanine ligase